MIGTTLFLLHIQIITKYTHIDSKFDILQLVKDWQYWHNIDIMYKSYICKHSSLKRRDLPPIEIKIVLRDGSWMMTSQWKDDVVLLSRNPKYIFTLQKKRTEDKWRMKFQEPTKEDIFKSVYERATMELVAVRPLSSVTARYPTDKYNLTWFELAQQPDFKIKGLQQEGNINIIEFEYTYMRGIIHTDVNQKNLVIFSDIFTSEHGRTLWETKMDKKKISYIRIGEIDRPICESFDLTLVLIDEKQEVIPQRYEFGEYRFDDVPDELFRLTYYGIPEPVDVEGEGPRSLSRVLWLLLICVALFALSGLFGYLYHRKKRR